MGVHGAKKQRYEGQEINERTVRIEGRGTDDGELMKRF